MRAEIEIGPYSRRKIANWLNVMSVRHPRQDVVMHITSSGLRFECGSNTLVIERD
jgi:hypothetical protein